MITVCDQLEAMTGIADILETVAEELASTLNRIAPEGQLLLKDEETTVLDLSSAKEMVLDEVGHLRALVTDLRHQEDTINTQRLRIRDLAAMRSIHGGVIPGGGGGGNYSGNGSTTVLVGHIHGEAGGRCNTYMSEEKQTEISNGVAPLI